MGQPFDFARDWVSSVVFVVISSVVFELSQNTRLDFTDKQTLNSVRHFRQSWKQFLRLPSESILSEFVDRS